MPTKNWSGPLARGLAAVTAAFAMSATATAQPFPGKPVRIIVPVAAGSATDLVAREMAPRLARHLGQPVVVENRAGGDMTVGIVAAARSAPDGYTWMMVSSALTSGAALKTVAYDPVKDFTPLAILGYATTVAVVPASLGVRTMKDFVALAKASPGTFNYAYPGSGTLGHLNSSLLEAAVGIRMTGVPYKGSSSAMADLIPGRVQFMMAPPGVAAPHVDSGRLVALGVVGPERLNLYPRVPTMQELGIKGVDLEAWMGLLAPAGTPEAIVARANAAIEASLREPDAREAIEKAGLRLVVGVGQAPFARQIRHDVVNWPRLFELAKVSRQD